MTYRRDIDGLRAIAVLPVVAFHAGIHVMRGGFVGVDIFFVISGFLITQLLMKDIEGGKFSLSGFYERRIRRILPALIAVLFVVYFLGFYYYLPEEFVALSKSLIAADLSVSNFYFWSISDYFDRVATTNALVHTWSLAVEEQFYLFWPLFLFAGYRFLRHQVRPIVLMIAGASLAASAICVFAYRSATFYLPFTRVWELAAGGLLVLGAVPVALGTLARNALAGCGLILIIGSLFLINPDMPFPGLLAVPPCLGALMVMLGNRDGKTLVGQLLATRPMVFIGMISYSLYLWHWPIVVFQKNHAFLAAGLSERQDKLLIIGTSILCAILSWAFIEQPFRSGPRRPSRKLLWRLAGGGAAMIALMGAVAWGARGFPSRYSAKELEIAGYLNYSPKESFRGGTCFVSGAGDGWKLAPGCLAISASKKNYLLLGDSHAAQLYFGMSSAFKDTNILQATAVDCFPTIVHSIGEDSNCSRIMDDVFHNLLAQHDVDRVFLVARWKEGLLANVSTTLQWLKQRHIPVTLVGPTMVFDSPFPRLLVSALRSAQPALIERHLSAENRALDAKMLNLARSADVGYLSLIDMQCPDNACEFTDSNGLPLIFDQEHLTAEGSVKIANRILANHEIGTDSRFGLTPLY